MPQIALGVQHKRNDQGGLLAAIGAKGDSGTDLYVSATKLYLSQSLLLNATVRATRANQMGLLGFGGDQGDSYQAKLEVSAAYMINRKLVAGVEYRMKPSNLGVDHEKAFYDAFVAWFPTKNVSVTAAYAVLGDITVFNPKNQKGAYVSVQAGF